MKMKRTIKIALCAGVILAVAACFLLLRSKTVCGISEGTYRMVTEDGSGNAPAIHFDMSGEKIRFVFGMDPRMSFAIPGLSSWTERSGCGRTMGKCLDIPGSG